MVRSRSAPKPGVMPQEFVPTRFAKSLLRLVQNRGYETGSILHNAGIDFNPMQPEATGYQDSISALQYTRLYQQVLSLLQDESFGLQSGKGVTPGAFRMMCYAIIHCENLGKAIRRACEFFRIFYEPSFHLTLWKRQELASMGYPSAWGDASKRPVQASDAYGLSAWHRFCGWLIGRNIELKEVRFMGCEPEGRRKYERLFATTLTFGAERNEVLFESRFLDLPIVQNENSLKEFLRTAPYQLLVMPSEGENTGLIAQVRQLMGHDFSQGLAGFDQVASALNMSAPTLRRRLKREGISYQQLKDECRKEAAIAYLSRPELSINAVAALMGFTDPSAFHRSFKKWTGQPPGQYRVEQFAFNEDDEERVEAV